MESTPPLDPKREAHANLPSDLAEKAASYLENEYAHNTWRAYKADFRHFTAFCQGYQFPLLPTTVEALLAYLTTYAEELKISVLSRRLSAIKKVHEANGHDSPTEDVKIRRLFRAIRRTYGTSQKQARPALKKRLYEAVSMIELDTKKGLRDRCLLLLGFVGAFRRSELVALDFEDLYFDEKGLTVYLKKSKTDQEGRGDYKIVPYAADPKFCTVRAALDWLRESEIREGSIFRPINKSDRIRNSRLSDMTVYRLVKKYIGQDFSAHSLRAGFVTQAKKNGADDLEIMRQTKHKSRVMIERYTRIESAWEHNAALKI